jgi:hypothetical protein
MLQSGRLGRIKVPAKDLTAEFFADLAKSFVVMRAEYRPRGMYYEYWGYSDRFEPATGEIPLYDLDVLK